MGLLAVVVEGSVGVVELAAGGIAAFVNIALAFLAVGGAEESLVDVGLLLDLPLGVVLREPFALPLGHDD